MKRKNCFLLTVPLFSVAFLAPLAAQNAAQKPDCCAQVQGRLRGERFPQTRRVLLSKAQLGALNKADLRYAINEIYARYGLTFADAALQEDFCRRPWYHPQQGRTALQIEARLGRVEKANLKALAQERARRHGEWLKRLQTIETN